MKPLNLAISFLTLLLGVSAVAAETGNVSIIERKVLRDSSEHNRMKVSNSLMVQLGGTGPTPGPVTGLLAAHFIDSDRLIQIEGLRSKSEWGYGGSYGTRMDIQGTSFGLFFKQFSGNSFYFKTGIDYSTLDYSDIYHSSIDASYDEGYSFKGNKLSGSISIGNQWQWESFTLGCDWIGWSQPITHSSSDEKIVGTYTYTEGHLRSAKERHLRDGYILALHVYLGASF